MLLFIPAAFAVYDGEILFRNIPWDTDIVSFREQITSEIQLKEKKYTPLMQGSGIDYFDESEEFFVSTYYFDDDKDCVYRLIVEASGDVRVAEWPISRIEAYAIQKVENGIILNEPSESQIFKCIYYFETSEIADVNLALENVKEKLVDLYGDIDLTKINEWSVFDNSYNSFYNVWFGENTFIELYANIPIESGEIKSFTLSYGITNVMDLVKEIENAESPIDFSSIDGL